MKAMRIVIPVAVVLAITGCSGEDAAENLIEQQIESESGEDVDIDFDDGGISIQTEDGGISIETDDEGNVSIQTEDGEMSIDSDGNQTVIQTDDGEMSIDSDDGETVIQSEDGETVIGSSTGELPDDFPSEIPMPGDLAIEYTQSMSGADGQTFLIGGTSNGAYEDVSGAYIAALEAAGFSQQQLITTPDGNFFSYDNGTWNLGGSVSVDDGATAFVMTVTPSAGG
jgi:hypothetical protein